MTMITVRALSICNIKFFDFVLYYVLSHRLFVHVNHLLNLSIAAPSQPPSNFSVTVKTSTSIRASWQLPPADATHGIIEGFKLFYERNDSVGTSNVMVISDDGILTKVVTQLEKYTLYDFQVLTFTSVGDGPNSSVLVVRTKEDGKIKNFFIPFFFIYWKTG